MEPEKRGLHLDGCVFSLLFFFLLILYLSGGPVRAYIIRTGVRGTLNSHVLAKGVKLKSLALCITCLQHFDQTPASGFVGLVPLGPLKRELRESQCLGCS